MDMHIRELSGCDLPDGFWPESGVPDCMVIVGNLDLYCVQEPYKMRFVFLHKDNNTGSEVHKAMIGAVICNRVNPGRSA